MPVLGGSGGSSSGLGQYLWSIYKCINTTIPDNSLILIPRPGWTAQFVAAQGCWISFFFFAFCFRCECVLIHTFGVKQVGGKKNALSRWSLESASLAVCVRKNESASNQNAENKTLVHTNNPIHAVWLLMSFLDNDQPTPPCPLPPTCPPSFPTPLSCLNACALTCKRVA